MGGQTAAGQVGAHVEAQEGEVGTVHPCQGTPSTNLHTWPHTRPAPTGPGVHTACCT